MRRQAESDEAASRSRQAHDLRLFTVITLMENFTAALNVLYDEILLLRSEGLEFPTEAVALCDKMNFKQVKINASTELMERQRMLEEEKNRDRAVLVNQQLEFLLQDSSSTSLSKELQRYMQGSEESKQRVVAAVAPPSSADGAAAQATAGEGAVVPLSKVSVDAKLRLNRNFDESCASEADRKQLEKTILAELAAVLSVPPGRLEIERFGRGSVVVHFCILPLTAEDQTDTGAWGGQRAGRPQEPQDATSLAQVLRLQMTGGVYACIFTQRSLRTCA